MNVIIVNCFDTYEERVDLLHAYFVSNGHKVTVIQSDFRHFKKVYRTEQKADFLFVPSKPYYKNLSFSRMKSHYIFAKNAFKLVENNKPDLIYAIIPPNSIAKFAANYKKKNPKVKLIFDLIDLWPETMPIGKIKNFPPFSFWQSMRDKNLKHADFIISECDLFRSILKDVLVNLKSFTLYLAKKEISYESIPNLSENEIHLCYLGSINNIIDIQKIKKTIEVIHRLKPTTIHIIGDGENREKLMREIKETGASVEYYGKVYDYTEKQRVFDKCHFGINIMKDEVCVGLTMKSIDYFQGGLPIINNIQFDTERLVNKYSVGINIMNDNIDILASSICNLDIEKLLNMRKNARKVFEKHFSVESFNEVLDQYFTIY
ncbi:glycosyltransferase [Paenibacillus sp. FSL H7-0716]|uniref:Glycosyltransferase WbuB n=1 Tax=Paenibacillus odorifer TaxID=189426 RepID=A0AB36JBQ4_9BACL|nr:glycosyltransferase [Paenibacillus odorifer]OME13841.1 hypothetical protein BSK47_24635 [Paenibacillus odorifer]